MEGAAETPVMRRRENGQEGLNLVAIARRRRQNKRECK